LKLIIAGSRNLNLSADSLDDIIFNLPDNMPIITEVVCGMAKGIDLAGRGWAINYKIPVKEFPADWDKYGKSAGFIRNKEMAEYADAAIVCWDGKSRGSVNMIEEMKRLGKPVFVWQFKPH